MGGAAVGLITNSLNNVDETIKGVKSPSRTFSEIIRNYPASKILKNNGKVSMLGGVGGCVAEQINNFCKNRKE